MKEERLTKEEKEELKKWRKILGFQCKECGCCYTKKQLRHAELREGRDLIYECPNCGAIIHRRKNALTEEEAEEEDALDWADTQYRLNRERDEDE